MRFSRTMEKRLFDRQPALWIVALIVAAFLVFPIFFGGYFLHLAIMLLLTTYLAQSWNIVGGYAGQLSFGHAIFYGAGAYASTLLFVNWGITPWAGMFVGGLAAVLLGLFIGYLSFRYGLRGLYFGLVSIAFNEVFLLIAKGWIQGGSAGIMIPLKGHAPAIMQFTGKTHYYYLIMFLACSIMYVVYRIDRSKMGYYFRAIKANEAAAESLGVNSTRYKLIAVGLSSFFAALGGTFYAQYILFIDPEIAFRMDVSLAMLIPAVVGGLGTVFGPALGSLFIIALGEIANTALGGQKYTGMSLVLYGVVLMVFVIYVPRGLIGSLKQVQMSLMRKKAT
jgi:branched-chain amino acid transport system permease protein